MWWLIGEMWWLIVGDVVDYCWRCGGLLLEIWWLIVEDVVAHCWRCGDSLLEMRWFMGGDVVAHWLRTSLLGQRSRVLYSASPTMILMRCWIIVL